MDNNVHFENIKEGEKITINGKTYIKVKLQFVDSLNVQTTNQIEILTSENDFLNEKIEIYKKREVYFNETLEQLKIYNRNIYYEYYQKLSDFKEKRIELENKNKELRKSSNELIKSMIENNSKVEDEIKNLKDKNLTLERELKEIKRTKKLPNSNSTVTINKANIDHRLIHLNEKNDNYEKRIKILEREIEQSEKLVETLTRKIFEKELKICELMTK